MKRRTGLNEINSSSFFSEFLSFIGEIAIQQDEAQYYIDHHKCIYPCIAEYLAEVDFTNIF